MYLKEIVLEKIRGNEWFVHSGKLAPFYYKNVCHIDFMTSFYLTSEQSSFLKLGSHCSCLKKTVLFPWNHFKVFSKHFFVHL